MPKSYSIITYDEKKVLTKEQIQKVKGHIDENKQAHRKSIYLANIYLGPIIFQALFREMQVKTTY